MTEEYKSMREKARKLADAAPPISPEELAQINRICYTPYIFRRRKTREIWTTCCGRHEIIPEWESTSAEHDVLIAEHQREPGPYESLTRETTPCPYCGAGAFVKELGRTGSRKNLHEWRRAVVFRWYEGALWMRALTTHKSYPSGYLIAQPEYTLCSVYRFKPGEAVCAFRPYISGPIDRFISITERPAKLPLPISEPFNWNTEEGNSYSAIWPDEVDKSPFRYCGLSKYAATMGCDYVRFLTLCCIFPRQVEMLMKAGLSEAVHDLICHKKWNAAAFNWSEPDPLKSFNLNKQEMKEFLSGNRNLETLGYYKQLRRQNIRCSIPEVQAVRDYSPYEKQQQVITRLKLCRIEPARWVSYIAKERMRKAEGRKQPISADFAQHWLDYIDAAKVLGYDLKNPLVAMPRGIMKKHDEATAAALPIRAAKLAAELSAKQKTRLRHNLERYEYSDSKYIIRPAINAAEIVEEGKALKHCVGGYAERHMNGYLTILFLRLAKRPDKPLVTIEMNGARMVQIHGYDNERSGQKSPREKYASILEPWLEWVNKGSRRDKDGKPVPPKKKETEIRVSVQIGA